MPVVVVAAVVTGLGNGLTSALLVLGVVGIAAAVAVRMARPTQRVEPALVH